jgi:PKD repeat protein
VAGSVPSPASQPPVVAMSATPSSGTVPLSSSFSAAGSSDPDGSIVAYEWTFGDGSAPASGATASHVYNVAGSYSAQLKLTDNSGLSTTRSVTISAQSPVVPVDLHAGSIAMSLSVNKNRIGRATAAVSVLDSRGQPVPGATVTGQWSGVVAGSASALSGSNGVASLGSPNTKSSGTFVFTITGISLAGFRYDASANVEVSDAITR